MLGPKREGWEPEEVADHGQSADDLGVEQLGLEDQNLIPGKPGHPLGQGGVVLALAPVGDVLGGERRAVTATIGPDETVPDPLVLGDQRVFEARQWFVPTPALFLELAERRAPPVRARRR